VLRQADIETIEAVPSPVGPTALDAQAPRAVGLAQFVRIGGREGVPVRKVIFAICGALSGVLAAYLWVFVFDGAFNTKLVDPDPAGESLSVLLWRTVLAVLFTVVAWACLTRARAKGSASEAASRTLRNVGSLVVVVVLAGLAIGLAMLGWRMWQGYDETHATYDECIERGGTITMVDGEQVCLNPDE
jgi:hypothetical protein